MGGLGLFIHGVFSMIHHGARPLRILEASLGLILMLLVKYYVLLCLIPPLLAYAWQVKARGRAWPKYIVVHVLAVLLVLAAARSVHEWDILYHLSVKQRDFVGLAELTSSGSFVMPRPIEPRLSSFLLAIPAALYATFINPFHTWDRGMLGAAGAAENTVLLIGLVWMITQRRTSKIDWSLLLFAISFTFLLALIIGWSIPIVGAMLRYRVPLLPFITLIGLLIADPDRLFLARRPPTR